MKRFASIPSKYCQRRFYAHHLPKVSYPVQEGIPPLYSPQQFDLHFNKHHQTYVNKLNDLCAQTEYESLQLYDVITKSHETGNAAFFNNSAQHFNHSFMWSCLKPNPSGNERLPQGDLAKAIDSHFGSFANFKKEFTNQATTFFGSGWVWLVVTPTNELKIWSGSNADTPIVHGLVPLFTMDVWEHAYYKDYENRRPEYISQYWSCANWEFAESCFQERFSEN